MANPGDVINLQGHAFGSKPQVWCSVNGAKSEKLKVVNAGKNVVHIRLPLTKGRYRLKIFNGTAASDFVAFNSSLVTPFISNMEWPGCSLLIDFHLSKDHYNVCTDKRLVSHASGDGSSNDQAAIQQAIDIVAARGGGVVYLPAGSYKLDKETGPLLELKCNVALCGAGKDATTINFGYSKASPSSSLVLLDKATNCGISDLALENISTDSAWLNAKTITAPVHCNDFSLTKVRANLKDAFRIDLKGDHILVSDCQLTSLYTLLFMSTCTNSQVRNNTITQKLGVNLDITRSSNCVVENNKFILDANKGVIEQGNMRHGVAIDLARNLAILNNQWSTINGEAVINNDGEALLSEGGGGSRKAEEIGKIVSGNESQSQLSQSGEFVDGAVIAIISGKGLGQWRSIKSRNGNSIALEKPWTVSPDHSSNYSIFMWSNQNITVAGNSFSGWPRGIWFYQASTTDTQISHNQFKQMDGIFIQPCQNSARNGGQFNPVWNTVIDHNRLTSGKVASYINITADLQQTTKLAGTMALNNQIYRNRITRTGSKNFANDPANFEGYCSYLRVEAAPYRDEPDAVNTPTLLGTIFQGNTVQDDQSQPDSIQNIKPAYLINGGAYQTTIIAPPLGNDKSKEKLVLDSNYYWNTAGSHGSVDTVIEH